MPDEKTSPQAIAEWLRTLPNVDPSSVQAARVQIGKTLYDGALYTPANDREAPPRFYLVGALPKSYQRSTKTAYRFILGFINETRDWYVSGYFQGPVVPGSEHYHPFGPYFQVSPWTEIYGEKIDQHEAKPYKRINVGVAFLSNSAA